MLSSLRHTPRLYIDEGFDANATLSVGSEQSHYLKNVMRLKENDVLRLFNGRDGEWRGSVGESSKRGMSLKIHEQIRPQQMEPDLQLCCAPTKKAHFEYMIEKATELGVCAIQPVLTARTQIREINAERCRNIAVEAAEQSERLSIPEIHNPQSLKDLASGWPRGRLLIVCAEWGDALPAREAFSRAKDAAKAALLTGPEGGLAAEELDTLRKIPGVIFVRLGPRILRADTAAIAALSCWQALCGDWK